MRTPAHLTRRYAYAVAYLDLGFGLAGLLLPARRFAGVSYNPARKVFSFLPGDESRWWCWLLTAFALLALACLIRGSDKHSRNAFAFLSGFWAFWTIAFFAAWWVPTWSSSTAGPWAPLFAAMCVLGNSRPVFAHTLATD